MTRDTWHFDSLMACTAASPLAATTLTGCHFLVTTVMMAALRLCGFIKPTSLPFSELLKFAFAANFSIVGMNVSLMWNTVGFYQVGIAIRCLPPCSF